VQNSLSLVWFKLKSNNKKQYKRKKTEAACRFTLSLKILSLSKLWKTVQDKIWSWWQSIKIFQQLLHMRNNLESALI